MVQKKSKSLFPELRSIRDHIEKLIDCMSDGLYEKRHIMSIALLSAIAGESVFLLGPPGTAKSMVARRLKMVFKEAKAFEYLMSRFSTPDEIFGPVSISKLKNEDKYERLVEGYLPNAEVVFLDEIWKAGPAIQNALLTAINERIFKNGSEIINLPMKALIAASNELPAEDEGLEALWDRFLVRIVSNCITSESTFYKMIRAKNTQEPTIPIDLMITDELYKKWQACISDVEIPNEVCHTITSVRKALKDELKKEDINKMDFYISDRRWKKVFHLMQASAWLNGRNKLDLTDCILLFHCLWNKVETIPTILAVINNALTSELDIEIAATQKALDKLLCQMSADLPKERINVTPEEDEYAIVNYFYYIVEGYEKGACLFAKADYNHIDMAKDSEGIIYFEEKGQKWIIHAIYTGAPFDFKINNGKIFKVKLKKCAGGIIIDGIPCSFRRKNGFAGLNTNPVSTSSIASVDIIGSECNVIKLNFEKLKSLFSSCDNIFVSKSDKKLVSQQLNKTEKSINELEIKIQNTKLLIQ